MADRHKFEGNAEGSHGLGRTRDVAPGPTVVPRLLILGKDANELRDVKRPLKVIKD